MDLGGAIRSALDGVTYLWTVNAATTPSVSPGGCHIGPVPVNNAGIRVAGPRRFHLETSPLGTRPGGSPCDTSCQHDQRATDLLGWPSLVSLAARQLSRPLGKHDMCVAENALVEASVRIRVRVDVDVDAQGAGAPCDGC